MTEGESGNPVAVDTPDNYVVHSEEVAKEAQAEVTQTPEPETEQSSEEGSKKPGGFKRKITRLEAENAQRNAENAELKAQLAKFQGIQAPQAENKPADPDKEPSPDDYENVLDYLKDQQKWEVKQGLKTFEQKQAEQTATKAAEAEYQKKQDDFNERATALDPEFFDKATTLYEAGLVTPELENAILDSDVGEQVGMYLYNNPQELMALQGLPEKMVYRAIAKIESKLGSEAPAAVKQTRAAAPISPVKPNASASTKSPDDMDFEEYKQVRGYSKKK